MGMGEPLLNHRAVVSAIGLLQDHLGIAARKILVSTVGVPKAIPKLATLKLQCKLAVSLHAPNQQLREQLVPSAKNYDIDQLLRDCSLYFQATSRRMSFEYTLLGGVNDRTEHVRPALLRHRTVVQQRFCCLHSGMLPHSACSTAKLGLRLSRAWSKYYMQTTTGISQPCNTFVAACVACTLRQHVAMLSRQCI